MLTQVQNWINAPVTTQLEGAISPLSLRCRRGFVVVVKVTQQSFSISPFHLARFLPSLLA